MKYTKRRIGPYLERDIARTLIMQFRCQSKIIEVIHRVLYFAELWKNFLSNRNSLPLSAKLFLFIFDVSRWRLRCPDYHRIANLLQKPTNLTQKLPPSPIQEPDSGAPLRLTITGALKQSFAHMSLRFVFGWCPTPHRNLFPELTF
jgi:hypothetical protein